MIMKPIMEVWRANVTEASRQVISEGETAEIDINEIWTAYILAGSSWSKVKGDSPEKNLKAREKEIKKSYQDGQAVIDMQKGRAEATAVEIKAWAKQAGFPSQISEVTWTARPGDLQRAYDPTNEQKVSENNPADILLKFDNDTFLGVSLKSTKMPSGVVAFGNFGGNYVHDKKEERKFPLGLTDVGGKAAWTLIEKDYEENFQRAAEYATGLLQDAGYRVPTKKKERTKFYKQLKRTYMGEEGVAAEMKKVERGEKQRADSWTKEEPLMIPRAYASLVEGVFYKSGYKHTQYYRDRVFEILDKLSDEDIKRHVLVGLLRTNPMPMTIVATGRGNSSPYSADIETNPSNPPWLVDAAAHGYVIEKSGNNILTFYTAGESKQKLVSVRMKWVDRPFAGSIKPTLAK